MSRETFSDLSPPPVTGEAFLAQYAARFKSLFDAANFPLTAIGGTADAVTATLTPALTAGLVDGMKFTLTWGAQNTGGVTLAINGAAAVPVLDAEGAALLAGAVDDGLRSQIEYVGGSFRVLTGLLLGAGSGGGFYFEYTASGTWTKPAALPPDTAVIVQEWGAGGGGGTTAEFRRGGGGGGAYMEGMFRAADLPSSVAVGIGAGGAPGSSGGDTTFGALLVAYGGGRGRQVGGDNNAGGGGGGGSHAKGTDSSLSTNPGVPGPIGGGTGDGSDATTIWGGGGGANVINTLGEDGGRAIWGGGGGGSRSNSNGAGGVSIFGGNGGAAGSAGQAPGGGGGAGAAGARGECRVWVLA